MKDYCINDFQRKSFILNFNIVPEERKIILYYADKTCEERELNLKTIKWVLMQMRNQITNFKREYEINKKNIKSFKLLSKIYSISILLYLSCIIMLLINFSLLNIPLIIVNLLFARYYFNEYDKYKAKTLNLQELINDYEKNLFFVEHSEDFENAAISYDGLCNSSLAVMNSVVKGASLDELLKDTTQSSLSSIGMAIIKDKSEEEVELLREEGFKSIKEVEYPIFNENSIDELSMQDLKQYQSHNNSGKGAVLVKTMIAK